MIGPSLDDQADSFVELDWHGHETPQKGTRDPDVILDVYT
jgi:hypothetical protein